MKPEHIDVGRKHFVVLSRIDCAADETTGTVITNPSARTYTFSTETWTCDDLPATDTTTTAWAIDGTRRRLEDDYYELLSRQDPHEA